MHAKTILYIIILLTLINYVLQKLQLVFEHQVMVPKIALEVVDATTIIYPHMMGLL
jgi:hypothetical protein